MSRDVVQDRDRWIRLFNRLEAAVTHHKRDTAQFTTDADERLYAARERILRDAAAEAHLDLLADALSTPGQQGDKR